MYRHSLPRPLPHFTFLSLLSLFLGTSKNAALRWLARLVWCDWVWAILFVSILRIWGCAPKYFFFQHMHRELTANVHSGDICLLPLKVSICFHHRCYMYVLSCLRECKQPIRCRGHLLTLNPVNPPVRRSTSLLFRAQMLILQLLELVKMEKFNVNYF